MKNGQGIQHQLNVFASVIKQIDPALFQRLTDLKSEHLFFAFRWILILFKREFEMEDTLLLWDMLFADHLLCEKNPKRKPFKYHVAMAMLQEFREFIFLECESFEELLKAVNSKQYNIRRILGLAHKLSIQ